MPQNSAYTVKAELLRESGYRFRGTQVPNQSQNRLRNSGITCTNGYELAYVWEHPTYADIYDTWVIRASTDQVIKRLIADM